MNVGRFDLQWPLFKIISDTTYGLKNTLKAQRLYKQKDMRMASLKPSLNCLEKKGALGNKFNLMLYKSYTVWFNSSLGPAPRDVQFRPRFGMEK